MISLHLHTITVEVAGAGIIIALISMLKTLRLGILYDVPRTLGVVWGGRWLGGLRGIGHMYTYG